jgi:Zn-dependent protease
VLAQLAVALPLIALGQFDAATSVPSLAIPIGAFGYFSVLMVGMNLVPAFGLDGAKAWQLLPILVADRRAGAKARKAMRDLMKRLKQGAPSPAPMHPGREHEAGD